MTATIRCTAFRAAFGTLLLAWFIAASPSAPTVFALDEVNLHISAGISGNALLYKFTKEKGFYREEGLDPEQPFGIGYGGEPRGLSGSRHVLRPSSAATTDDVGRRHTFLDSLFATSWGRRHVTKCITIPCADSAGC